MSQPLPFAGIRVIEFAHFWSVPYGTMFLASQGADVVKVEPPDGDVTRLWGKPHCTNSW